MKIKNFSHRDHRAHRDKEKWFYSVTSVYSVADFFRFLRDSK